jgi:hypothetical protein
MFGQMKAETRVIIVKVTYELQGDTVQTLR